MNNDIEILVVDDDRELAETLRDFLRGEGYAAAAAGSGAEALELCHEHGKVALALVDLMMPGSDGMAVMEQLHQCHRELPVVIMTGFGTIETAVEAMKRGAEDYLTKPFDREAVRKKVGRLMELHRLRHRVAQLEARAADDAFGGLVYVSQEMQRVVDRARAAAGSDAGILVLGETGTGKERLARAIHAASTRCDGPFVAVNCGALPRELVESELFGVRRGAYTGAYADAPGIFVAAKRGTVFLDEIGEMPKEAQVKLLRVLQDKELRPVGGTQNVAIDVRVIAATNRPLAALRQDSLREDLYFRLATVVIEIPPLRQRREDILVLAQWFAAALAERSGRHITLSRSAIEALLAHSFPGNVRELQNALESVCALSSAEAQEITAADLSPLLQMNTARGSDEQPLALEEMERLAIQRAIRLCRGNRTRAAALLGISRDTLYRKIRDLDLPEPS